MALENKKGNKFKIADPKIQLNNLLQSQTKYNLGEKGYDFYDIKHLKPTFAFDYLSLNTSDLCFNSPQLNIKDFIGLLDGLKKLSSITYDILKRVPYYRFHSVDFDSDNISITRKDYKAMLTFKEELLEDDELPTLYQFDFQYVQEARVFGFLYKGIFYLVWYDRNHIIYKR
jgi:hypothetical protein